MKIVMVGPVYPYKGGISHYTGLMCKNLRKEHEVVMLSYERQYPKILFRKEQRDYDNDAFAVEDTQYLFHTYHPWNWIWTARWIQKQKPDLVIFQWWHPYFAPAYWTVCKLLKNTKILFVCHNVFPHERFPLDRFLVRSVLRNGDYFIVHSAQDERHLKSVVKNKTCRRTVHPTYNAFKMQNMSREEGRTQIQCTVNEKILLFFGFVREYKGLKHLIRAMPKITSRLSDVKLLVVGDFSQDKQEYLDLIHETNTADYVKIYDGYIPDKEVEKFFAASDLVVLPYESATQSGIVQIAYGFEKPVVVTNVGGLPEVVLDGKTGYVVPPKDPDALADAVIRFFEENQAEIFHDNVQKEADRYSWDRMNEMIMGVYQEGEALR